MKIAAIHFENFVFILLVVVAYLFQFLTGAATRARKRDQSKRTSTTTPPPVPRAAAETEEARVRKFLEALGQPTTTTPPPRRRSFSPPGSPFASPLPPLKTQPPELPPEIRQTREKKIFTPRVAQAPTFEVHESPPTSEPIPLTRPEQADAVAIKSASTSQQPATDVVTLLRSPSGLRDAIVLREIFGPPRSLQPLDLVGSV
jgi:hypothetical protein